MNQHILYDSVAEFKQYTVLHDIKKDHPQFESVLRKQIIKAFPQSEKQDVSIKIENYYTNFHYDILVKLKNVKRAKVYVRLGEIWLDKMFKNKAAGIKELQFEKNMFNFSGGGLGNILPMEEKDLNRLIDIIKIVTKEKRETKFQVIWNNIKKRFK